MQFGRNEHLLDVVMQEACESLAFLLLHAFKLIREPSQTFFAVMQFSGTL